MADLTPMLAYAIVILFFLVALPRDNSFLGAIGSSIDHFLTLLFGTSDMAKCPFLRKGMIIHQFTQYEYPMKVYASSTNFNCAGNGMTSADSISTFESTQITIPILGEPTCELDEFMNFISPEEGILRCDPNSDNCQRGTTASAVCAGVNVCLICDKAEKGFCECEDQSGLMKPCDLEKFMVDTFFSAEAEKERELFSFMGADMPPWVCYVVFGIFPFLVIYYLVQDILQFTLLRSTTKRAVALAVAMLGIFSGAFVGITVGLVKFMNFSTNQATLFMLIGVAMLTSVMLVFQTALQPAIVMGTQARKLKQSIKALKSIYSDLNEQYCPKCKKKLPRTTNVYCPWCGAKLQ
jgi:hypothetical protein